MGTEVPEIVLLDAQSLQRTFPGSFWIPSADDLAALQVGFQAKVRVAELEADGGVDVWSTRPVWLRIEHRDGDALVGTVVETFADLDGFRVDDPIHAELRHVLDFESFGDEGMPLLNEARARSMIGKRVLIAITYVSEAGELIDRGQLVGVVSQVDRTQISFELPNGGTYTLPPTVHPYEEAAPGDYRLRSTGEVVVDPDFTCTWTITQPENR